MSRAVAEEAAHRLIILGSDESTDEYQQECRHWCQQDPEHEEAWRRAINLQHKMGLLPGWLVKDALQRPPVSGLEQSGVEQPERRHHLTALIGLIMAGPAAYLALSPDARQVGLGQWHHLTADYHTRAGEQQQVELSDGSTVSLNTSTSVSIHYSAEQRLIVLHQGEIEVITAKDIQQRPLSVRTAHGLMTALGTRFMVRLIPGEGQTTLAVQEGAVAVSLATEHQSTSARVTHAGQYTRFDHQVIAEPQKGSAGLEQWRQGMLVAQDMPLGQLIEELSRYRSGWLRCDPDVAQLKLSGVFRLDNTDQILNSLSLSLPVTVVYRTPYWVSVKSI
ncbi:FecR domain-containing protein [Oceanospirillum sediminis]|uniref:FecR domain-containing protein n=1 Tax=Oceanospirillum sediminis TaxID=2760088 RepID=A0A839IWS2_9GAMM|nr:FecR domain-containing protein [Oceanospirillum sediminis]